MLTKIKYIGIGLIVVAGFIAWRRNQVDPDVRAIERTLTAIVELIEKQPGESQLESLTRARRVSSHVAEGAVLQYQAGRRIRYDAETFPGVFAGARALFSTIQINLSQHTILIHDDRSHAQSTARVSASLQTNSGQAESLRDNFIFEWIMQDGKWHLSSTAPQ